MVNNMSYSPISIMTYLFNRKGAMTNLEVAMTNLWALSPDFHLPQPTLFCKNRAMRKKVPQSLHKSDWGLG